MSRKVAVGAAWLVAWRLVTRSLGIVSTLIMARILLPADFGLLAMATTFAATIDSLSQVGVQDALVRRQEDDERLHDTAFTLQAGRAVLTALIIVGCAPVASAWFAEPRLTAVLSVLAAGSAISGLENIGVVAFRRDISYDRQFQYLCIPRLCQVAVTIGLALLLRSYWALVIGSVTLKTVQVVLSYVIHPYRPRLSLGAWHDLAGFSFWTWAATLAAIVWNRGDPFVIGPATGATALGIYLIATEIATLPVSELVAPAAEVLLGGFSLAQRQGTRPAGAAMAVASTLLFAIMPIMLAISGTSGYFVTSLLGPTWTSAQPLIAIAVWLGLFSPFSYVCNTALISTGQVRLNFFANACASAIRLLSLVVTVRITTDLLAIATVSVLVIGAEAFLFVAALRRVEHFPARDTIRALLRLLASTLAVLTVMRACGLFWRPEPIPLWHALLAGCGLGIAVVLGFAACTLLVWTLCGRPDGPETRAATLLRHLLAIVWARAVRLLRPKGQRSLA